MIDENILLTLFDGVPYNKIDIEHYIAAWELLAEDSEFMHFKNDIDKGTKFLKHLMNNYGCKTYRSALDAMKNRLIDPVRMKFFIDKGYVGMNFIYYARKGYPELADNINLASSEK